MTTISLIYLALYNFAKENGQEERAAEINDTYIVNKYVREENSKLKLKQTDNNSLALKYLLSENNPEDYNDYSRVIENYSFFKNRLTIDNFETVMNGLKRLLFVEISLERGKDDPQRIFESLNSTGLELSQADLIRNYILMGLAPDKQIRVFNTYWNIIEEQAKDEAKNESKVSEFIRDYLTLKNKKIPNKNKVYAEFKLKYEHRDEQFYTNTLTELKNYARLYNKLINPAKESDLTIQQQLKYINRLEINVSYPFLIPVYDDYDKGVIDKQIFINVLKLVQSFTWRRFIIGLPTNALNKIFMTLYGDVDTNDYIPSIERALIKKVGSQRFPNNKEIKAALKEKDVYNIKSKNRNYFLELLENHNNREYVAIDNPHITIEHIFPQTPTSEWKENLDEHEFNMMKDTYLHTIGNLTLSGNNGSLSNKTFTAKKSMNVEGKEQGYAYSRLWLNAYLKTINEWTILELNTRFEKILKRFCEIWTYPSIEELFENESNEVNIFEAEPPRNKKIEYFIFRNERVITNEFSKLYTHIMQTLFNENPRLFITSELKEYLPVKSHKEELRVAYQVNENYYIEVNLDSNGKFRRIKQVLQVFGLEDELSLKYGS